MGHRQRFHTEESEFPLGPQPSTRWDPYPENELDRWNKEAHDAARYLQPQTIPRKNWLRKLSLSKRSELESSSGPQPEPNWAESVESNEYDYEHSRLGYQRVAQ